MRIHAPGRIRPDASDTRGMCGAVSTCIGENTVSQIKRKFHCVHLAARSGIVVLSTVALLFVSVTLAVAQGPASPSQLVAAFVSATHDYAQLHRKLEGQIGSIDINSSVESINRTMAQLAAELREHRSGATQGDLFTPALAHELRLRIDDALRSNGFTTADVRDAGRAEAFDYSKIRLYVNDTFPWALAVAMFPCVIEMLPPLPPELQYRIVGDDLLLIDVHASIIVDLLPSVLMDDEPSREVRK
jgi:hypothetical protein